MAKANIALDEKVEPRKWTSAGAIAAKNGGKTAVVMTNECAELAQSKNAQPFMVRGSLIFTADVVGVSFCILIMVF